MKIWKKVLCSLLVVVLCLTSAPLGGFVGLELPEWNWKASAVDEYKEGYYTYTVTDGKATIIDVDKSISGDIVIPSTLGGYPVTAIGNYALLECFYITSVVIPETVISIGEGCFGYSIALECVEIPENVISIGMEAFACCMSLEKLIIKNSETAFGEFVAYTEMTVADGYTIEEWIEKFYALWDAENNGTADDSMYDDILAITVIHDEPVALPTVTIYSYDPSTAKTYAEENGIPFKNISELEETLTDGYYTYTVADGEATIIDVDTSISGDIVIPSTLGGYPVVAIGRDALVAPFITSVSIPEGVTSIGNSAFAMCVKLKSITLPETLTEIGNGAFGWCLSLKEIILPERIEILNDQIFFGCFSLERLVIKNPDIDMNEDVLPCYTSIEFINITKEEVVARISEAYELYLAGDTEGYDKIMDDISNHLIEIETPKLLPLTIYSHDPSTAKTYAEENGIPFKNISELEETLTDGYYTYTVADGEATIIDVDTSISGDIVIPSTLGGYPVVAIGDEAFAECIYLTGVTIPEGVTTVGYFSFSNCIYVTQVSLPESLTSIGELSFNACLTLKNISLPKNLSYIGRQAFNGCLSLEEITIPEKANYIHDMAFSACISLHKLVINNPTVTFGIDVCTTYMLPNGIPKEQWISEAVNMQEARSKNEENAQDYYDIFALHTTNCSVETPLPDLTIYSYDPSTAKTYAEENGIPFKNISELEEPHTCSFGEWFTETEPTVFSEGVSKRVCECGEFETKSIAKLESASAKDETTKVEITYTEENFESEIEIVVSEEEINANIVFGDEFENFKSFDISLEADGEKIQPKGCVTVKLPIPEGFNADSTVVYYIDDSGNKIKLESTTENGYIVFETDHFSEYVLVDVSSRIEPPHVHSYTASITKEATCTENGTTTYTCSCGDSYNETIEATGHDFDGSKCKNCDYDKADTCGCNCHKNGIAKFFFNFILFFQKIFKANKICKCGINHY